MEEPAMSIRLMGYSHCMGPGPGMGPGSMGSTKLCRSVHTALRQGQGPGPIASYCATPIPLLVPVPVPCSVIKPQDFSEKLQYRSLKF